MAKNKQAKKKERERRVAQKKLAEAARKRDGGFPLLSGWHRGAEECGTAA